MTQGQVDGSRPERFFPRSLRLLSSRIPRSLRLGAAAALCAVPFLQAAAHPAETQKALSAVDEIELSYVGHEGTGAQASLYEFGAGGAGSAGMPLMVGGEKAPQICDSSTPLKVLFLGNSYTHYFEMPHLFAQMAESAGCAVDVDYVAPGGSRLKQHAASGESLSAIGKKDWDVVVLQNFSQLPSQPLKDVELKTLDSVEYLAAQIRANNPDTSLYYYVTWGRRDGDSKYCETNPDVCTFRGHTAALYRGYSFYQQKTGGILSDVGGAFAEVERDRRRPFAFKELYDRDGSHPSLKGSYLSASVFFATIFRASPEGLAYPHGLSESSARYLQKVAGRLPISGA